MDPEGPTGIVHSLISLLLSHESVSPSKRMPLNRSTRGRNHLLPPPLPTHRSLTPPGADRIGPSGGVELLAEVVPQILSRHEQVPTRRARDAQEAMR